MPCVLRRLPSVLLVALLVAAAAACGGGDGAADDGTPRIVVTTPVLGAVVSDLVGDRARVDVLMPNGVDPHDFQPSAKDAERLQDADLVVVNGLDLEEGLVSPIREARDDGVAVFAATDHVRLRALGEDTHDHGNDEHADDGNGTRDPHIWTDPVRMSQVVAALAPVVRRETGVDVADRAADLRTRLAALDEELAGKVDSIPADRRVLVTGHESMGYFAERYGLSLVGAVIPSLSSQAEPSARQLADLAAVIRAQGVPAVFTEIGTPTAVAQAVADETGVPLVEIATHTLPDDGSYLTFMRQVTDGVVDGLTRP